MGYEELFNFGFRPGKEGMVEINAEPSDYLLSLPLQERINQLTSQIEDIEKEIQNLKNPLIQFTGGVGILSKFEDDIDKPTAIARLELVKLLSEQFITLFQSEKESEPD